MKIVIKIGGSTLYNNYDIKLDLIKKWIKIIKQLRQDGHRIGVVIGGGK
ncbi:UMP kinase, partial [archaeon]|nr:UMP kinase [archaeon]